MLSHICSNFNNACLFFWKVSNSVINVNLWLKINFLKMRHLVILLPFFVILLFVFVFQTYIPQWLSLMRGSGYTFVFHGFAFSDSQWLSSTLAFSVILQSWLIQYILYILQWDWYSRQADPPPPVYHLCLQAPLLGSFTSASHMDSRS